MAVMAVALAEKEVTKRDEQKVQTAKEEERTLVNLAEKAPNLWALSNVENEVLK